MLLLQVGALSLKTREAGSLCKPARLPPPHLPPPQPPLPTPPSAVERGDGTDCVRPQRSLPCRNDVSCSHRLLGRLMARSVGPSGEGAAGLAAGLEKGLGRGEAAGVSSICAAAGAVQAA